MQELKVVNLENKQTNKPKAENYH